ncbi:MAG: phosphatase PAP2 family protein [Fusicatenibacter sp.]|nr:phosphatase PAP2 family protein [Fusicatenibacter sp.]
MKTIKQYKHLLIVAVYGLFYLACFHYLEQHVTCGYHLIRTPLDEMIPFCEFFVIPYLMWFGYIAWSILYFGICNHNRKEYYQLIVNLGIGMTLFLIISYLYPNGQNLRPSEFPRSNVFTALVQYLYAIDTPTNIFPSIHVYNSVAVAIAVEKSENLKNRPVFRGVSTGLAFLIVLSTMFLKQHSVSDVCCALVINAGTYMLLYRPQKERMARPSKRKEKGKVRIHI